MIRGGTANHADGQNNQVYGSSCSTVSGASNVAANAFPSVVIGDNNTLGTPSKQATRIYLMGYKLSVTPSNPSSAPMMVLGRYNQEGFLDAQNTALALVIGNGTTDGKRSSCFAVDYNGNIYCSRVIETGSKNIFEEAAAQSEEPAALSARAITAAADVGIHSAA